MKRIIIVLLICTGFIVACNQTGVNKRKDPKGPVEYGGTLKTSELEPYHTLYPYNIIDIVSSRIASQIYEGLVKYNMKDLSIVPAIAEKWEVSEDGLKYKFYLKKGVLFQDDVCFSDGKGREVTAEDFKYSFNLLCTYTKDNSMFANTFKDKVVGANKFFEASKKGTPDFDVEGIKIIDDYTLEIELVTPSTSFIYALALQGTVVVAKEAVEKYGDKMKVGTGPFILTNPDNIEKSILVRNENYYGTDTLGNQLPYLDSIVISYLGDKNKEIESFMTGSLDIVTGLYSEGIREVMERNISDFQGEKPKYIVERASDMTIYYIDFNINNKIFKDRNVRLAFNYAINRAKIVEKVLKNQDESGVGNFGITPIAAFNNYDTIRGYNFDLEKAKSCFAKAGFANGKNFPNIKLLVSSRDKENIIIAAEIQNQLRNNLNVNIEFENKPLSEVIELAKYAKYELLLTSWTADYPNPETFLWLFYGKNVPETIDVPSFPNMSRYVNESYDKLFEAGTSTKTLEESYKLFAQAEKILIQDAPIVSIWNPENFRLQQAKIKGFYFNPLKYVDFSKVYLKEISTEKNN